MKRVDFERWNKTTATKPEMMRRNKRKKRKLRDTTYNKTDTIRDEHPGTTSTFEQTIIATLQQHETIFEEDNIAIGRRSSFQFLYNSFIEGIPYYI